MHIRIIIGMVMLGTVGLPIAAQVCRFNTSGLNRNRRVTGPVHAECPLTIHSVPFGNWGVTSNFGQKQDGSQFQGWCRNTRVCDNQGNCRTECRDGWYEWNSCTDIDLYRAPNCTLYNDKECTAQVSATGQNIHGTRAVDVTVRCPSSSTPGGVSDQGGCGDVRMFNNGTNFMSLYEIDPGSTDDLIQTMYFPAVSLPMTCDVFGCRPTQSAWLSPVAYDSPTTPAKVSAEFSMTVNSAMFIDTSGACRAVGPALSTVPGASFRRTAIAPDSIASVFGSGLATTFASANVLPLPTDIGGTRVTITDASGVSRPAPLFYVSPDQVNIHVPSGTRAGTAQVVIARTDTVTSRGSFQVEAVSPDIFAANGNGQGVAAATAVRVNDDGSTAGVPVFRCDPAPLSCVPAPMSLQGGNVYLSLYATGIRAADNVRVTIGGTPVQVLYAGPQRQYVGLDQVNILLPESLRGRGTLEVAMQAGGAASNMVVIAVQ
jgi:uncharacterized protein (TIGR03437 family)